MGKVDKGIIRGGTYIVLVSSSCYIALMLLQIGTVSYLSIFQLLGCAGKQYYLWKSPSGRCSVGGKVSHMYIRHLVGF